MREGAKRFISLRKANFLLRKLRIMEKNTSLIAAIDIGTNSIRLAVVRSEGGLQFTTLALHREVVRLGEGEFETNQMTPEAIARGTFVCAKFAQVARGFGAQEIVAFATSAVREAENREEFIRRVQEEAGIEVRVISGVEEARLIWLGVSSGIDLGERKAVLIDIGGGSTEVIVGRASRFETAGSAADYDVLESMKLGSIRMSNHFPTDEARSARKRMNGCRNTFAPFPRRSRGKRGRQILIWQWAARERLARWQKSSPVSARTQQPYRVGTSPSA